MVSSIAIIGQKYGIVGYGTVGFQRLTAGGLFTLKAGVEERNRM